MDIRQVIRLTLFLLAISPLLLATDYRFVRINVPNSTETQATGINARGDIVGSYIDADGVPHGFLLRKGVFTIIEISKTIIIPLSTLVFIFRMSERQVRAARENHNKAEIN